VRRGWRKVKYLPTTAAAAAGVQVGSAIVATRFVVDQIGPASLALLNYGLRFVPSARTALISATMQRFHEDPDAALLALA
jgi:hypothetical protein